MRNRPGALLGVALLVELPITALTLATDLAVDIDLDPERSVAYGAGTVVLALWAQAGHHVVLALTERVVAADRAGRAVGFERLVRSMPWLKLLVADVVLLAIVAAGFVALIVPGLILYVLVAPVFPLLALEGRSVRATIARSMRLVRPHFWWLTTVLLLTWGVAELIALGVGALVPGTGILDTLGHALSHVITAPISAAAIVTATFELVDREPETVAGATPG